jgi:hypothetical protein
MIDPNINNDDVAMMEIITGDNQCARFEDLNNGSQYIADYEDIVHDNLDEQENIVQDNTSEIYLIIYHVFCIHV